MKVDENSESAIIRRRKFDSQNILKRLIKREHGLSRRLPDTRESLEFYTNIFPNLTVANVERPPGYLRKFTPDGKYLLSFSYDQTSVEIYKYLGVGAPAELLYRWKDEYVPNVRTGLPYAIRSTLFGRLFKLQTVIPVTSMNKQLNRECSIFTDDMQHVIVGGTNVIPEENRPSFYEIYTSNEAITYFTLEHYTIYLINYLKGTVSDTIYLYNDRINLSHNQGIYLYKNTFAILSIAQQTIHIYEIVNGKFVAMHQIGRFCCSFDRDMYKNTYPEVCEIGAREKTINSLKHRILVFMYKLATSPEDPKERQLETRKFFQHFNFFNSMRIYKMQLLDEEHLMIKYSPEEVVTMKNNTETSNFLAYYVVYNIPEMKVIALYHNASSELLQSFEQFCDWYRNSPVPTEIQYPCSTNNNLYAHALHMKWKNAIINARGGGKTEATKRLNAQLPISAQSFSSSPYLDLGLYSYDDKWISILERPKTCGEYPIAFFSRSTGLLKFRIFPGLQDKSQNKGLVAFIFHPTEPFAISVQRVVRFGYFVNFHIRNEGTIMKK